MLFKFVPCVVRTLCWATVSASAIVAQCSYTWQPLGAGIGISGSSVIALATFPDGSIVAFAQGLLGSFVRWDGTAWTTFASANANINALLRLPNNHLLAGGSFQNIGGVNAGRIARWNGTTWLPLGLGIDAGIVSRVNAIAEMPNGDIVIGGYFVTAGGVPASNIARWNGSAWSPLGSGVDNSVYALAVTSNGDLVAGGSFTTAGGVSAQSVARWNGGTWQALGAGTNGEVNAIASLSGGQLLVGGTFTSAGGVPASRIARWSGAGWSPLGAGVAGPVLAIVVRPSGDAIVGGTFVTAGGVPASLVARWNGANWGPVGSGLDRAPLFGTEAVAALALTNVGDIVAGGSFTAAAGSPRNRVARFAAGCPASVSAYGSACTGTGGTLQLGSMTNPVIGNTFSMASSGFPAASIAARMIGSATASIPLSSVHPAGQVGCDLLVSADMLFDLALPVGGTVPVTVPLPNSTALISLAAFAQVASIELGSSGAITNILTSNGLAFVVGTF